MSLTRSCLTLLLLASMSLQIVTAVNCTRPYTPRQCQAIRMRCPDADDRRCQNSGNTFLPGRGLCGYCDICAKFVGCNEQCNTTTIQNLDGGQTVEVTTVCKEPFVCTQGGGICVDEDKCVYNN